jgi:hypothetical protein
VAWHLVPLCYSLLGAGFGVDHTLAARALLAPSARSATGDAHAFLEELAPVLVPLAVFGGKDEELERLAALLGLEVSLPSGPPCLPACWPALRDEGPARGSSRRGHTARSGRHYTRQGHSQVLRQPSSPAGPCLAAAA